MYGEKDIKLLLRSSKASADVMPRDLKIKTRNPLAIQCFKGNLNIEYSDLIKALLSAAKLTRVERCCSIGIFVR